MKKIIFACVLSFLCFSIYSSAISIKDLKLKKYPVKGELKKILQENLNFFADGVGVDSKAKIPYDTIFVDKETKKINVPDKYVNTTEIGEYLSILVLLAEYGKDKSKDKFLTRIQDVLNVLWNAPNWKGLFYWPYNINNDGTLSPGDGGRTVPVVDNGNLCFALAGVIGAFKNSDNSCEVNICEAAQSILDRQKEGWAQLYDEQKCLLRAGWNPVDDKPLGYYIDRKANESRLGTIWAILSTKDSANPVPVDAFSNMKLYTNEYTLSDGQKINCILTWDGTVFQILLPRIYIKEHKLIPDYSIVLNFVSAMNDFINKQGLPAMMSASSSVDDGYASFGVPELSESFVKFHNPPPETGAGTPHASALIYLLDKPLATKLLFKLEKKHKQIKTPYGYYDAINAEGKTCTKILSLDQGMFVLSLFGNETANFVEKYLKTNNMINLLREIYSSYIPNK